MRFHSLGKSVRHKLKSLVDNLPVVKHVGIVSEFDIDHRDPDTRGAADGFHAVRSVQSGLNRKRDQRFDFFGCHPWRFGHDDDARTIQVREHVNWHLQRQKCSVAGKEKCDRHHQHSLMQSKSNDCIEHF